VAAPGGKKNDVFRVLNGEETQDELVDQREDGGIGGGYTSCVFIPFRINERVA
jgi:hypothetical protein